MSTIYSTSELKPDTFSGNIQYTLYIPPFYNDNISASDIRCGKILIKSENEQEAAMTLHANPIEPTPIIPTENSEKVWRFVVNPISGVFSIDNEYSRNSVTLIESSSPVIEINPTRTDTSLGNGEIIMNKPLIKKYGNDNHIGYVLFDGTSNETFLAADIREVGYCHVEFNVSPPTIQLDTAANIFNSILYPNLKLGHYFDFYVSNDNANIVLSLAGTGITALPPALTYGKSGIIKYRIICTDIDIPSAILIDIGGSTSI